jgi:hypothetical protein
MDSQSVIGSKYMDGSFGDGGRCRDVASRNSNTFDDFENILCNFDFATFKGRLGSLLQQNECNFSNQEQTAKRSESLHDEDAKMMFVMNM